MAAYEFTGTSDTEYPWGTVHPGDVAYFAGRAPDGNWTEVHVPDAAPQVGVPYAPPAVVEPPQPEAEQDADAPNGADQEGDERPGEDVPTRPNKAASAEDWKAYAAAHGGFEETTGKPPADATRKEIVDHYTAADGEGAGQ